MKSPRIRVAALETKNIVLMRTRDLVVETAWLTCLSLGMLIGSLVGCVILALTEFNLLLGAVSGVGSYLLYVLCCALLIFCLHLLPDN